MSGRTAADDAPVVGPSDGADKVTRVLDAAAELFARHGVGRTSIDDVARRARVGRNTVFRRVGTKDDLVHAVVQRELKRLFADLDRGVTAAPDPVARMVAVFATTVRAIRAHPMLRETFVVRVEDFGVWGARETPDLMQQSAAYVEALLAGDRAGGHLNDEVDIAVVAEVMVRLVHSVVLVPALARSLETDADLRAFATAALAPLLRG